MSVLELPRVYFRGQVSWDPIVTNNYEQYYDEDSAQPEPPGVDAKTFRATAIADIPNGNWNPHGTHRARFFNTEVSGVDHGRGLNLTDALVGAPIDFMGMLVDCEPYGSVSSQLFFDQMRFGIAGGSSIACAARTRMTARYINFSRNSANRMIAGVASVVWQTSFAKEDIILSGLGSEAVGLLQAALGDDAVRGLTVRWNSYRTVYYDDPCLRNGSPAAKAKALALQHKMGPDGSDCWQPNPARSLLVGVLGLWSRDDPAGEPGDRALLSIPPGEVVGSAHARLNGQQLAIDLANSISEIDSDLTKQNLGPLTVLAVDAGVETRIGTITYGQYARAAYEQTAGIVTLSLSPEGVATAADGNLRLRGGDGTLLLDEQRLRAIPDVHNQYIDEGGEAPITLSVYDRGRLASAGAPVAVFRVNGDAAPIEVFSGTTDGSGEVVFTADSVAGGACTQYIFTAGDVPAPAGLDTQLNTYAYVRTLPADDQIAALEPSWSNVYSRVLVNWHAMAPCMDNWLDLGDEAQVRRYGSVLRTLTDPARFERFNFMPVVRDMTAGERTLLYKFLDSPVAASEGAGIETDPSEHPASLPLNGSEAEPDAHISKLAKLSRAMRGG